jgi:hypothetical protein
VRSSKVIDIARMRKLDGAASWKYLEWRSLDQWQPPLAALPRLLALYLHCESSLQLTQTWDRIATARNF